MPDNRIEQDGLYGRINSLEEEIADLKYTNQKLYKDCVTFAKKLKKIQVLPDRTAGTARSTSYSRYPSFLVIR